MKSYFFLIPKTISVFWDSIVDKKSLEIQLAVYIPVYYSSSSRNFRFIDLLDYFSVKEKLNPEVRYLLSFWAEIYQYRNKTLSVYEKKTIKYTILGLFKITTTYFGIYELNLIPSAIFFLGEQIAKEIFVEDLIHFIEKLISRDDDKIPYTYIDFKTQFGEFIKENVNTKERGR